MPDTAFVIWGQLKTQSGKAAAPQSIRFPTKDWTAAKAKKWLKDNKVKYIKFEPAAPAKKKEDSAMIEASEPTAKELQAIETNYCGFIDAAKQLAQGKNITMTEAMKKVRKQNPQLYEDYRKGLL